MTINAEFFFDFLIESVRIKRRFFFVHHVFMSRDFDFNRIFTFSFDTFIDFSHDFRV